MLKQHCFYSCFYIKYPRKNLQKSIIAVVHHLIFIIIIIGDNMNLILSPAYKIQVKGIAQTDHHQQAHDN